MFYSDSDILTLHQELVLHVKSFLVKVESTSVVTRVRTSQITAPTGSVRGENCMKRIVKGIGQVGSSVDSQ